MSTIWKDIPGFENHYQISNTGHVRSLYPVGKKQSRLLSLQKDVFGYVRAVLSKGGRFKMIRVHRLVAQAFIPNPENKRCVNHKDFKKHNNHVNNLEWMTHKENSNHSLKRL